MENNNNTSLLQVQQDLQQLKKEILATLEEMKIEKVKIPLRKGELLEGAE